MDCDIPERVPPNLKVPEPEPKLGSPNLPTLEEPVFAVDVVAASENQAQININKDTSYFINNQRQDAKSQDGTIEKEEEGVGQYQSRHTLRNSQNFKPSTAAVVKEIDWDSDELWDRKFLKRVMDEKREHLQQLQSIEQRMRELEEKEQQMVQRDNDLKVREAKLNEIKPLLPSVRELQSVGITFDLIIPYLEAINEKSALENIDLKTAAWNMVQNFREYRNLTNLHMVINQGEQRLKALGNYIRQNEAAINTLINLKKAGFTEKKIAALLQQSPPNLQQPSGGAV